jgi:hypothetical protein
MLKPAKHQLRHHLPVGAAIAAPTGAAALWHRWLATLSDKLLTAALALAVLSCHSLFTASCAPATVGPQDAGGQATAPAPAASGSIKVAFALPSGGEHQAVLDLIQIQASLTSQGQQPALGYLFNRVYDDGLNDLIATDSYLPLDAALEAAAQDAGLALSDIWYPGCMLQFTIRGGWDAQSYTELDFGYYQDFSFERLSGQERYFYDQAQSPAGAPVVGADVGSGGGGLDGGGTSGGAGAGGLGDDAVNQAIEQLYVGDATPVPTVLALSMASDDGAIPVGESAGEYLDRLLAAPPAIDLRSDMLAPRLLWGLSPDTRYDVTEYRFPSNIVGIRIIPPPAAAR